MKMTRALAGGNIPSKENPPLDIKNVSGGGGNENAYIEQLKSRERLLEENQKPNPLVTPDKGGPMMANMTKKPNNMVRTPIAAVRGGGTYLNMRKAQEGNIALPMGGMPPPPAMEDESSVSPEMAKEAESLGIEVAPPGATAEEVADDQLVLLSEGELVVPANVVRYHGLAQYEKMRKAALNGLDEMDKAGQLVSPQETPDPEGLVSPDKEMA